MTQEMTQECVNEGIQANCCEVDAECLETPVFETELVPRLVSAGGEETVGRGFGKISRFLAKRSATARFAYKSQYNPRYTQEMVNIEGLKRRVYAYTVQVY